MCHIVTKEITPGNFEIICEKSNKPIKHSNENGMYCEDMCDENLDIESGKILMGIISLFGQSNSQDSCPQCKSKWCSGSTDDAMLRGIGEPCQTYYDGCHCCSLCHGFLKCAHGKWDSEKCVGCNNETAT